MRVSIVMWHFCSVAFTQTERVWLTHRSNDPSKPAAGELILAYSESLADRICQILGRRRDITKKEMFGGVGITWDVIEMVSADPKLSLSSR